MKPIIVNEVRELDEKVLNEKVKELRIELFNLRMKRRTTGLDKPHLIGIIRKNMARLLMVLGEKIKV